MNRDIWLRRSIQNDPCVKGEWKPQSLYALGIAAAHEISTTSIQSFAGVWVNLFQSFLASPKELKWYDNGLGLVVMPKLPIRVFSGVIWRVHTLWPGKMCGSLCLWKLLVKNYKTIMYIKLVRSQKATVWKRIGSVLTMWVW